MVYSILFGFNEQKNKYETISIVNKLSERSNNKYEVGGIKNIMEEKLRLSLGKLYNCMGERRD